MARSDDQLAELVLIMKALYENKCKELRDFYTPHEPVTQDVGDFSMTRQEFKDECDINVLMAHYERNGVWPGRLQGQEPQYLDVSEVPDLATAMNYMRDAEEAFMSLPAVVRREFDNDAVKFVEFAEKPENIEKMREWKLAPPAISPSSPGGAGAPPSSGPPGSGGSSTQ